jgi:predicted nucleotidyltransferase
MSTRSGDLGEVLFGKTRRAILGLLFGRPDEAFYLREIVRRTGSAVGAVQRELLTLVAGGIVRREDRPRQAFYTIDARCPIREELSSIFVKTSGVADALREALAPLEDEIRVAFIFGSVARGGQKRDSDVDLLIIGSSKQPAFGAVIGALQSAQKKLEREINPVVYQPTEFRMKLRMRHHFVTRVMRAKKVFVLGDEHELGRVAQERLAAQASA